VLEIVYAFSARGWKGFILDLLLGVLYIVGGAILLSNFVAGSVGNHQFRSQVAQTV